MAPRAKRVTKQEIYETASGFKVKFRLVPHFFVEDLVNQIEMPEVPKFYNESQDRWQENPMDPEYLAEKEAVEEHRQKRHLDALLHVGVTLVDHERPPKEEWFDEIERMNEMLDGKMLERYDTELERDLDILYKKYIVMSSITDLQAVYTNCTTLWTEVRDQIKKFRDNAKG